MMGGIHFDWIELLLLFCVVVVFGVLMIDGPYVQVQVDSGLA